MKKIKYLFVSMLAAGAVISCSKTIDNDDAHRERDLLEIKLQGQMGTAVIERDGDDAKATLFVYPQGDFSYAAVEIEGVAVSAFATASIGMGDALNFNNPERRAKITVTSESGESLDWSIYVQEYDPFYVGVWSIVDVKLHCDQTVSGSGVSNWDTQWWNHTEAGNGEFGTAGIPEFDNVITVTMNSEVVNNRVTGTITNAAGPDGEYGSFEGIMSPYSAEEPLDMNPRLRHLLPEGDATWELDLTTQQMRISKNNITSTMTFVTEGDYVRFNFKLPDASGTPSEGNNFFDNMWRGSTDLFYVMQKVE
jgi:hypothetical protein